MCRLKMAHNDLHLFLKRGEDEVEAWKTFENFVKNTGGTGENVNNDRDFFDQWKSELQNGETGVRFERSSRGPNGIMTAYAVSNTSERKLINRTSN